MAGVSQMREPEYAYEVLDNELIAALAARLRVLERQIERLACYTWHAEGCAVNERYPCTCGLERVEI